MYVTWYISWGFICYMTLLGNSFELESERQNNISLNETRSTEGCKLLPYNAYLHVCSSLPYLLNKKNHQQIYRLIPILYVAHFVDIIDINIICLML